MVAKRVILAFVLSGVLNSVSTPLGFAQIINSPLPSSGNNVAQATGDFDPTELSGGVKQVGWPNVPWPTITMPKITMPKLPPLWPSKNSNHDSPALLAPFAAGFSKVSAGSKKAWAGTKDLFSVFQKRETSQTATRSTLKPKTSFWQRLITRKQEPPKVPQTVGEFMSQPRPKP